MARARPPTLKFCGRIHPRKGTGCVLEQGHKGRHLCYEPLLERGGEEPGPVRAEVWWVDEPRA